MKKLLLNVIYKIPVGPPINDFTTEMCSFMQWNSLKQDHPEYELVAYYDQYANQLIMPEALRDPYADVKKQLSRGF